MENFRTGLFWKVQVLDALVKVDFNCASNRSEIKQFKRSFDSESAAVAASLGMMEIKESQGFVSNLDKFDYSIKMEYTDGRLQVTCGAAKTE